MQRTITTTGFKWWEHCTVANRQELKAFIAAMHDMPDVPEPPPIMDKPKDGFHMAQSSNEVASAIRFRKEVPNMSTEEVWDARVGMMQTLVHSHLEMWANRKKFETGELKLKMRDERGKEQVI